MVKDHSDISKPILLLLLLHCEKEGNVLFNDALNTFYLRLYGVRHMFKDHSDREKGNLLPPHRLLFLLTARVLLYAPSHRQDSTYHSLCYTSRGALAGTRNRVHPMKDRSDDPSHHERTLLPRSYISLPHCEKEINNNNNLTMHSTHFICSFTVSDI